MEAMRTNTDTAGQSAHPDLRGWLQWLAATDRLVVARKGLSLIDELAAVAKKLEYERAVLFPSPGQHVIPVVANLFTDRSWIADSLGVPSHELLSRFQDAVRHPLPWVEVKAAPVQEVVHHEVDLLRQLPIPKHNEHDSGPYITAALLIARNPETGIQNVSIHRCQVSGPDRIGVLLLPRHTLHYFRMAEEAGEALEIALVIGVHPACILASQAIAALDQDEMEIAGALLGRPSKWSNAEPTGSACRRMRKSSSKAASYRKSASPKGRLASFRNIMVRGPIAKSSRSMRSRIATIRFFTPSSVAASSIFCSAASRAKRRYWSICSEAFPRCATCV